ncbi:MAG: hypothetical protein EBT77_01435 [Verrucomicrobia bacterium]|nr:hypothetical protein [Verrucomicrobiota bacterium]
MSSRLSEKPVLGVVALLLANLLPCVAGEPKKETPAAPAENRKVILSHYMPWYEAPSMRGKWGGHWTGWKNEHDPENKNAKGLPDIYSHYHPLIGPYDSTDPDVLECQLLQMKLAGIDGVVADWYGQIEFHDYGPIHQATQALFQASEKLGMKFCALYEDRTIEKMVQDGALAKDRIGEHLTKVVDWCRKEWFGHPNYVRHKGKPLFLNFGPIYVKDAEIWKQALGEGEQRPQFFCLHHLWRSAGADGGFTWVHFEAWENEKDGKVIRQKLENIYGGISSEPDEVMVSATVGFHDVYEKSYGRVDHRNGETLKESLDVCMEGPWSLVQLVTWNDYGEGTIFEPTHESGYQALETLQEARRKEAPGFLFTAEDLRLPVRLLELRRKGGVEAETLEKISRLLAEGKCGEARKQLDAAGAPPPKS